MEGNNVCARDMALQEGQDSEEFDCLMTSRACFSLRLVPTLRWSQITLLL